jgi:hypothetical protein
MLRRLILSLVAAVCASPLWATDVALVIANETYAQAQPSRSASDVMASIPALQAAGFDVISGVNLTANEMREALAALLDAQAGEGVDHILIVLSGHFAASRQSAWLLGAEVNAPGLARVDGQGLGLDTVLEIAAGAQETAIVMFAGPNHQVNLGSGLAAGLPQRLGIPQNVAIVRGGPSQMAKLMQDIVVPGQTLAGLVDGSRFMRADGFVPPLTPFLPEGYAPVSRADRDAWATARANPTEASYAAYLQMFPQGIFAAEARQELERLQATPEREEHALGLTRNERRTIQRDLTLLGFNTRGIDGIFGRGSRNAIAAWQTGNRYGETSFLTRDQIFSLAGQAARRAIELEDQERARRAEEERQDRALWRDTGSNGSETGLRAYLRRYPEGLFSGIASERLDRFEAERRRREAERENNAWLDAQAIHSINAYQNFLASYPEGAHASVARARIDALTPIVVEPMPDPAIEAARGREQALNLSPFTRVLIERRLARSGYNPGNIDGEFDSMARRAIQHYQDANGMPITGYVDDRLLSQLLADGLRGFFE